MLSFSLGSGANKRDHSDNGHDHASDSEATAAAAAAPGEESSRSIVEEAISSPRRPAAQPLSAAASISSSLRGRSRSPSGSPMSHRRTTGAGIGHTEGPSQLPTIPSASNIYASNLNAFNDDADTYSPSASTRSPLHMNGGHESAPKTRSSSLAATGSAPRNIPGQGLSDPIATGSPREGSRLYERGGTSVSSSFGAGPSTTLFSSSFPSSGGIWSTDPKPASGNASMPPPTSANPTRAQLSRHLSLSGTASRSGSGGVAPLPSPSRNISISGWPDSPLSVEEVALSSVGDFRQGRSRTRVLGNSPSGSRGTTPSALTTSASKETISSARPLDHLARSLSLASDRTASSGIGPGIATSNTSPFVRDSRGLPTFPAGGAAYAGRASGNGPVMSHPYSSSFSTANDFYSRGPNSAVGETFGSPLGLRGAEKSIPKNHGAVGSGRTASMAAPLYRNRRERLWDDDRQLRERDEDAFYDIEDEDEEYAPPTRSGATSRRHSVAAFTSSSTLTALTSPPPVRSQIGFQVPGDASHSASDKTIGSVAKKAGTSGGAQFSIGGSSRMDDEDLLATDLSNALHINLEAHAAKQRDEEEGEHVFARPGYDSRASSMPVQGGTHFDRSAQQHTSPFGSLQPGHLPSGLPDSPPTAGKSSSGLGHDRRASASGDPNSPSASAARFLATARQVQPPAIQPQLSPNPPRPQLLKQQSGISPDTEAGQWPPTGAQAFAQHQQSPNFRSGALPSPDQLRQIGQQSQPMPSPLAAAGGKFPSQLQHKFMSGPSGRGASPVGDSLAQAFSPPNSLGFLPPFAGFPAAPHMSGPPPPTLSPMNVSGQPYFVPPIAPQPNLNDLGRGVPLHALPSDGPLYIVEFKAGRTDLFYVEDAQHLVLQKGDLVVVEADRGKDLGKCLTSCTLEEVRDFQMHQVESALGQLAANAGGGATIGGVGTLPPDQQPSAAAIARMTKEIHPKKIYGLASPADVALLAVKAADEQKALNVCRAKVLQHQLPMEVTDAEFQFDRRRLTFFYVADRRIDFRNLVKDLFRLYKTRIWLCAIDNGVIQR